MPVERRERVLEQAGDLSVAELLSLLRRKGIPLPYEIGAFIALEVCEQLRGAPSQAHANDVILSVLGDVTMLPELAPAREADAVGATLLLLSELLVCSAPGVPPMLLSLVEEGPRGGTATLARLRDDLEACLLPLNRAATRRVLARLLREARRERSSLRPGDRSARELDAELDVLLGGEPAAEVTGAPAASAPIPSLREAKALPRAPAPEPPRARTPRDEELFDGEAAPSGRAGTAIFAVLVLASLGLGLAYWKLGQEGARRLLGLSPSDAAAAGPAAPAPARARAPATAAGTLEVRSRPAGAQVFLFVGPGPAVATDLPVGVAQEFLALSDGHAPARAVVPADASWDESAGAPRYELAMQINAADGSAEQLGDTLLTRDMGAPTGKLGSVRILTTPPGAKVYQLIGFTPEARVENLRLDRGYDVLVYREGHALVERHIEAADFGSADGGRLLALDVDLPKARAR